MEGVRSHPHSYLSRLFGGSIKRPNHDDGEYIRGRDLGAMFDDLVSVRLLLDASVLREEEEYAFWRRLARSCFPLMLASFDPAEEKEASL